MAVVATRISRTSVTSVSLLAPPMDNVRDSPGATPTPWTYSKVELAVSVTISTMGVAYGFYVIWVMMRKFTSPEMLQGLQSGFLFHRPIDMFDPQWGQFWSNVPVLAVGGCLHSALVRVSRRVVRRRYKIMMAIELCCGLGMASYLHGSGIIHLVVACLLNLAIAQISRLRCCKRHVLWQHLPWVLTWSFNLTLLFTINRLCDLEFGALIPGLAWLDGLKGQVVFSTTFRFAMLRMISFNVDFHRALCELDSQGGSTGHVDAQGPARDVDSDRVARDADSHMFQMCDEPAFRGSESQVVTHDADLPTSDTCDEPRLSASALDKDCRGAGKMGLRAISMCNSPPHSHLRARHSARTPGVESKSKVAESTYRKLQVTPRPTDRYSVLAFFAYVLYVPLYIAGPIASFNAWQAQMEVPQTAHGPGSIAVLGLRWVGDLVLMLLFLHLDYANALCANARRNHDMLRAFNAPELIMLSLSVIFFIWFKFLLIWRFFRLWALAAGVEAPENMMRCVFNHFSIQQFWRAWHRSFNQWLVWYIYIPLGGRRCVMVALQAAAAAAAVWLHAPSLSAVCRHFCMTR